ncbi:MAG TPA: PQQ-binding-like beta-propeller repeat protein [Solirubrobacteraceae bacterium]|nr:PQQ-binding-like beta-propeller repeat protein [Solirubrobacteraceae bacterium]
MEIPTIPFRGIDAFRYLDHPIFFARAEETHRLASLVSVYRGVMLYGDSGAGKSSLINAGLVPEAIGLGFAAERLRVQPRDSEELVVERLGGTDDVLPSVLSADEGADLGSRSVLSIDGFLERVRVACERHRLLLIFDQFEELVTLFDDAGAQDAQRRLVDMVVAMLRGDLPVKILLSFREDYLGKLKELLSQCPELVDQALRLAPPRPDALPTIIRGPFDRYPGHFGRELSPALAEQLVAALAQRFGAGDVSLSEVQTVCLRLWQSDNPEALLAEKGLQGLLEDYLGDALAGLPTELRPAAIALLGHMVTSEGTRNVISAEDLIQRVQSEESDYSPRQLSETLSLFAESRLVRRERRRDLYLYEITSEFLVPWISRRRAELRRSVERRRERRRLVIVGSIAAALLLLAAVVAGLAVWALSQRNHARSEARTAEKTARSLGLAYAQTRLGSRLDVGLLLSLEAMRPYHASPLAAAEARGSMIAALEAVQTARATGLRGILHGHSDAVYAVAYSPDGRTLASASADHTIRLWSVANMTELGKPLTGHTDTVFSVAFSPDGRTLASGSNDNTIRFWNVATHRQMGQPLVSTDSIQQVAFSPDGRLLASAGDDHTVRLWNVATHKPVGAPLRGHTDIVYGVAFSPDGSMLASAGADKTIRLWDVATHNQLGTLTGSSGFEAVAFSPDGHTLASGDDDNYVRFWNVATQEPDGAPLVTGGTVYDVAFSRDGHTLASANSDDTLTLWNVATHRPLGPVLTGHTGSVYGVAFARDGRTLASASADDTMMLWNVAAHGSFGAELRGHTDTVYDVAYSPDGRVLASAGADKTIRLWDPTTERQLGTLTGHTDTIYSIAFSHDGHTLASGSNDGTIRLWDVRARGAMGTLLAGHGVAIIGVAFSRDGHTLASAGSDKTVRLWDVRNDQPIGRPLTGHTGVVYQVAFSPDGRMLASTSDDHTVRLWNVATHKQIGSPLRGHTDAVYGVAFSPNGRILASASTDGTIRLWDVAAHEQMGAPLVSHTGNYGVAFSPDGRTLASSDTDNDIRLWDVATHVPLGNPLIGHSDTVYAVTFSPDGRTLASAGADNTVRLWPGLFWRDFAELKREACGLVGTGLSATEWAQFAPGIPYQASCS